MKNKGFFTFFICSAVIFWASALMPGCKKPSDNIGSDIGVVDGNINSAFIDTFKVNAFTVREDSVRADRTSVLPFGSFYDPYFGVTTSSMYLNFFLSGGVMPNGLNGVNQVDSVVLRVCYGTPTHFGDIGKYKGIVRFDVFRLLESLVVYPSTGSAGYGSTRNLNVDPALLGSGYIIPNPYDSAKVQGKNEAPQIRLKLNNQFGMELLTADPMAFSSAPAFSAYFKGLYVKVRPATALGDGGFLYLSPSTAGSRLCVYYNDTSKIEFAVNKDNCVWIARHRHDYAHAVPPFQNMAAPVSGQQTLLVQPLSGTKVKVHIPYIKNFNADKTVGINKAELVFPVDPAFTGNYPVPEQLLLTRYDAAKDSTYSLADYIQSSGANGGKYDADRKEYKFNITLHLQSVMSGLVQNDTLVLENLSKQNRGNRVALYGTDNPLNRVKLRIYYTKLQ